MKLLLITLLFSLNVSAQVISIIPKPNYIQIAQGAFEITSNTSIYGSNTSNKLVKDIQYYFKDKSGIHLEVTNELANNALRLSIDTKISEESYSLIVNQDNILISAGGESGLFYAFQSLKQLLPQNSSTLHLPLLEIKDSPRFLWRSYMLDESRYFHGEKFVKKILDQMALLKMNKFHWHLVDDAGWRIEIKKYPLLTTTGAFRADSEIETWESGKTSGEAHGGFYTQEQIKDIVAYAAQRHITVIPEIEMPGHSSAAIAAYTWLGTAGVDIDVPVKFGRLYDNYDVTKPEVVQFIKDVLLEVFELFPAKVIHIGGDEVGYKVWQESAHVKKYMQAHGINTPADLQIDFTNKISKFIEQHGRRMMGWNEILGKNIHKSFVDKEHDKEAKTELAKNVVVHFWKGDLALAREAAQKGYGIVNSLHTFTYLDYNYKKLSLEKSYSFNPIPEGLEKKYHKNIYGLGTQMWSEWTPTYQDVEYQTFPRIASFAETGWTHQENKDFPAFKAALKKFQKHWDSLGINYARVAN